MGNGMISVYITRELLQRLDAGETVVGSVFPPRSLFYPQTERHAFPKEWCYAPYRNGRIHICKRGWDYELGVQMSE